MNVTQPPDAAPAEGPALPVPSTVLVTGATGFTGSVLVRKLVDQGHRVRAIARPASNPGPLAQLPITWHRGELTDEALVRRAAQDVEVIFHLATPYRSGKAVEKEFHDIHVVSTQLLAKAALANPGFRRFVHVSTVGVHGHVPDRPADETQGFAPGDAYQQTKLEGELWIREFAKQSGLPLTVLRPAAIYGPGDRRLLKFFKAASRRYFILLGWKPCCYHLIHVDDLTNIMIRAAAHPAALNEVFICGNAEPIAMTEMARAAADALGQAIRIVRLPAWPFFVAAAVCEAVCVPLGINPPLYRRRVAFFTKSRQFDTRKLRETLGYTPMSNAEGIRATVEWYVRQGWIKGRR